MDEPPFDFGPSPAPEPAEAQPLDVVVIRSAKRKKTAQARLTGGRLEIRIPGRSTKAEEDEYVEYFTDKFERRHSTKTVDLDQRVRELAATYSLRLPESVRWVSNQQSRWGSCTPAHGTIRLSDRLVRFPDWVVDYVIVHELAHLDVPSHGPDFWAVVERYPLSERARGFLMAQSWFDDDGA